MSRQFSHAGVIMIFCAIMFSCRPSGIVSEENDAAGKPLPALSAAAKRGDITAVNSLLAASADPNIVDSTGAGPLQFAVSSGKIDVVQALLTNGANVRAQDRKGSTALHVAAVDRDVRIAELLLSAGADVNARTSANVTPLMAAVCSPYSDPKMSLALLRAGADVTIVDSDGETALLCAISSTVEVIEELLKKGANPNVQSKRFSGETPLHKAAFNGYKDAVEILLRYKADPAIRDYNGQTPLDVTNVKFEDVRRMLSPHDGH